MNDASQAKRLAAEREAAGNEAAQQNGELQRQLRELEADKAALRAQLAAREGGAGEDRALVLSGTRSPTQELERALRAQLHYSHALDEDILDQVPARRETARPPAKGSSFARVR